ncbi:hypothetical protein PITCH_A640071 [uncultured Desulfobacterium sp.]|uniref:CULT domain-containing protein n=1 Tax=uncultured Desulfobacterium sp. TaxID=201089 RepID=A0A445N1G0_9BACT|nr:hypothetical protein PITCH_A640071 [uncultured Desulfobacterium sp.]
MIFHFNALDVIGGNGSKVYLCIFCGGLIAHSDRSLILKGNKRHLFINPSGINCDFYTFSACPGVIAPGPATEAHSWFSGYGWKMAFCRQCRQHMGWQYNAVLKSAVPAVFWGILVEHVITKETSE